MNKNIVCCGLGCAIFVEAVSWFFIFSNDYSSLVPKSPTKLYARTALLVHLPDFLYTFSIKLCRGAILFAYSGREVLIRFVAPKLCWIWSPVYGQFIVSETSNDLESYLKPLADIFSHKNQSILRTNKFSKGVFEAFFFAYL